jgi:putative phosphoribosyl transferase
MRMFGPEPLFRDRRDAGRALAARLERYRGCDPLVLGLPRGGVVVAAEDLAMRRSRRLW